MAIVKCPKCNDPNFDDGACGCGKCTKCNWRQTCTQGGWYDDGKSLLSQLMPPTGIQVILDSMYTKRDASPIRIDDVSC